MQFSHHIAAVGADRALADPAAVVRCIPGVAGVRQAEDGSFEVQATTGVGPIRLKLTGKAQVRSPEPGLLVADVTLHDRFAGTVYGVFTMRAGEDALDLEADVTLGGRMGEFAQPLLRRKAEETFRGFERNLVHLLENGEST